MPVRPHLRSDVDRIAEILAAGWAQAYAAFMPPGFFAPRSNPDYRRSEIAEWLDTDFDPASEALFVAEEEGRVVGFIHMVLGDKADLGAAGFVNLLYVDRHMQRRGVGRALMSAGAAWLIQQRPGPLVLSAYRDNPFRHAYAAMGGHEARQVTHIIEAREIVSVLYLWTDPLSLLQGSR